MTPKPRLSRYVWVMSFGYWRIGRVFWVGPKWCEVRLLRPIGRARHSRPVRVPWNFDGAEQFLSYAICPEGKIGREWRGCELSIGGTFYGEA